MIVANPSSVSVRCSFCAEEHTGACDALRAAGERGAKPIGVPIRVQAAYVEAREALRGDAPAVAVKVLQWLLAHLAETRGASADLSFAAKLATLSDAGLLSRTSRHDLLGQARSGAPTSETAWALMTLAEHALTRAYLKPSGTQVGEPGPSG